MRKEPEKGHRIYRLYFNEEDPSDVALRRWIWSLPARKRGHIIKSILRKQLADWGRMKGRRVTRTPQPIKRMGSQRTIRAHETPKPSASNNDIQSLLNRAFASKASTP
ncbi:hypothetical protein [Nitrospira moscoviensis]|uniref:Uncharacterized protein n=1 Tax=Nitrospira moscoviensis TaxID=42253 RepID=A0A0K2GFV2_NITMO|nr:hypothetical protein [Nitrospira moscoviensis]ALA59477.1 hypothetical protein NITMOv2_3078 [Nitrospira moscoviensis]